ncbi:tRNA (adenosine(37)-N6)-threonylcarbamoyltransferase complex ATPase subunit type 1 TsaE [Haliovirga abyssi]|uniref:tRNA threonylcarbamoyladenosine biosynthesis protein TsaE n=1 Tax=Haliovirga abyssi TaxID=2996794 RepID=A0AAU9DWU2_9FUSO|nr:tRNA (adenosine(37)-N6)-threonylcarbamoyltransferase complex ATPase subunit type 1 TsaE [Haliovirga abyssi]BDU50791.1 tRNA (adenosine(37)-N6)-threonylcarbamoyltransferase complex ATPase subunit type 1 TsaE [Haliovirga abyssi]
MKRKVNFNEINQIAEKLSKAIKSGDFIALVGDLGTGKTTFVKEIAKNLGITGEIKSPTFTYVREYKTKIGCPFYHFDVYRIGEPEEVYEIGYEDYINGDGIVIVEWADLIEEELPDKYIRITLEYSDEESRMMKIEVIGDEKRAEEIIQYVNFRD